MPSRFANRRAQFDEFVEEGWESPWGLDYVFLHNPGAHDRTLVDGFCQLVGIRWVNFADVQWGKIEKRPPTMANTLTTGRNSTVP